MPHTHAGHRLEVRRIEALLQQVELMAGTAPRFRRECPKIAERRTDPLKRFPRHTRNIYLGICPR